VKAAGGAAGEPARTAVLERFAEGEPHGDFPLSDRRAREQQVSRIGARDHQHDANGAHQH
jgi:hypothetical protein